MPLSSLVPAEAVSRAAPNLPNPTDGTGRRIRVVGLGSPSGDDRAGWEVVARLRDVLPVGTRADATSHPLTILDAGPGDDVLIVIDACRGAGSQGSVHRFAWPDPRLTAAGGVSSHGVGLATALELAGVLGRLPPRVVVFAIECGSAEPGAGLSRVVEVALPEVVARVLAELVGGSDEPSRSRE